MEYHQKFSVSMCVYGKDNPEHFRTALDSILNQTCTPDEVVLVVDGPIPNELTIIIDSYEILGKIRTVRLQSNVGHGNARRIGISECQHELIALMDADDISVFDRFEKQLNRFEEEPTLSVIGGNIAEFVADPKKPICYRLVPRQDIKIKAYMKKRCPLNQMTVMFKKADVESAGGYIDWYCDEDYYLWIRMALAQNKFANLSDILVNVRVGAEMYQRRGGLQYFESEVKLQKFMLERGIISFHIFIANLIKRLIVQVLLPNNLRSWVFRKFARRGVVT